MSTIDDAVFYDTFYTSKGYEQCPNYMKNLIVGETCSHPSRPSKVNDHGIITEWFCSDQCSCRQNPMVPVRSTKNEEAIQWFMNNMTNVDIFIRNGTLPLNGHTDGMGTRQEQQDADCKFAVFYLFNDAADLRNTQPDERIMKVYRLLHAAFCDSPLHIFHFSKKVNQRYPTIVSYETRQQVLRARAQLEVFLNTDLGKEDYPHVKHEAYALPY